MNLTKLESTKQIDLETFSKPGPVHPLCGAGHFGRIRSPCVQHVIQYRELISMVYYMYNNICVILYISCKIKYRLFITIGNIYKNCHLLYRLECL